MEETRNKDKKTGKHVSEVKEYLTIRDAAAVTELLRIIAPVIKEKGGREYAIMLKNIQEIACMKSDIDITDEVIKALNRAKEK